VRPSAFFPPPKVESAVVQILWREEPAVKLRDPDWFKEVVRGCFGYRRKTLVNALKHSGLSLPAHIEGRINMIGIDPRRRPETLTIEEFARLAEALRSYDSESSPTAPRSPEVRPI
jgi:16S rRNA (adenine1518-N6/adenine1519-N6)-dimethyltransferase